MALLAMASRCWVILPPSGNLGCTSAWYTWEGLLHPALLLAHLDDEVHVALVLVAGGRRVGPHNKGAPDPGGQECQKQG